MSKQTPVNWTPWIQEALVSKANIVSMGFVEQDMSSVIAQGGVTFTRPYQANLRDQSSPVAYNASTTITPSTGSDYLEHFVVAHIGDGYYETEYDRITRGSNGLDALMLQNAEVVNDKIQDYLMYAISGVFKTALATSHVYNHSAVGSGTFGTAAVTIGTQTKFGEDMDKFDGYIMNSLTYAEAIVAGTAKFEYASDISNSIFATGKIPTYLGKRVLINDTLCVAEVVGGETLYPVYVVKGKPFFLAWQRNVRVYEDFEPAIGGGKYSVYWYADFVPAVKGVSWDLSTYVADSSTLASGASWAKVFEDKHIGILKILVKPTPLS
jgi:hypothetical protein